MEKVVYWASRNKEVVDGSVMTELPLSIFELYMEQKTAGGG